MKVLCRSLLVGVTGSSAAAVIPGHLLFLRQGLVETVQVIMTRAATRLVSPDMMRASSGRPVFVDSFDAAPDCHVPHIQLPRAADAVVIMPATANFIAKAAHGIADDLLSSAIIGSPAPVIIAPCMNEAMWLSKVVQGNVQRARDNGYYVMEPERGIEIADLQRTFGVMPSLDRIIGTVAELLARKR